MGKGGKLGQGLLGKECGIYESNTLRYCTVYECWLEISPSIASVNLILDLVRMILSHPY